MKIRFFGSLLIKLIQKRGVPSITQLMNAMIVISIFDEPKFAVCGSLQSIRDKTLVRLFQRMAAKNIYSQISISYFWSFLSWWFWLWRQGGAKAKINV